MEQSPFITEGLMPLYDLFYAPFTKDGKPNPPTEDGKPDWKPAENADDLSHKLFNNLNLKWSIGIPEKEYENDTNEYLLELKRQFEAHNTNHRFLELLKNRFVTRTGDAPIETLYDLFYAPFTKDGKPDWKKAENANDLVEELLKNSEVAWSIGIPSETYPNNTNKYLEELKKQFEAHNTNHRFLELLKNRFVTRTGDAPIETLYDLFYAPFTKDGKPDWKKAENANDLVEELLKNLEVAWSIGIPSETYPNNTNKYLEELKKQFEAYNTNNGDILKQFEDRFVTRTGDVDALKQDFTHLYVNLGNKGNIINLDYLYSDEEIQTLIRSGIGEDSTFATITWPGSLESEHTTREDVLLTAMNMVQKKVNVAVIPVNLGRGHWAVIVLKNENKEIKAIFQDSGGTEINQELKEYLQDILSITTIEDLQLKQQYDGSSCGLWVVDNAIKIAKNEPIQAEGENSSKEKVKRLREEHHNIINGPKQQGRTR